MLTAVRPDSPHGLAVLRRAVAGMLVGTGLVVLLVAAVAPQTEASAVAHVAIGSSVLAVGVVLWLTRRASRPGIEVLVLGSLAVVGVLVWLAEPLSVEPWLVLGPVALLATFCAVDVVVTGVVVAVVALGCGGVLADPVDPPLGAVAPAALAAGAVAALAWTTARARGPHRGEPGSASLVDAAELVERIDALAEQAIGAGTSLAVVVVASTDDADLPKLAEAVAARSRGDDVVAVLGDVVGVALPGARAAEATVYAARVATTLGVPTGAGITLALGAATVRDAADSADVLLRRARRGLQTALEAGPGAIGVEGTEGVAVHHAEDVAAVPGAGGLTG